MRFDAHCVLTLLFSTSAGNVLTSQVLPEDTTIPSEELTLFDNAFDDFVESTLRELHVPGLSVATVDNGRISSKGYGTAVLPHTLATADTQYMTGSTTKAFTAAAAALLVHDDKSNSHVKWTSRIQEFIPRDFALEDEHATAHTTIEDALSHRTGLPRHDYIEGQLNDNPSALVRRMRYLPMTAEPRTLWQYCNLMYAVMTDVLEDIHGIDLETILSDAFWKPLGMLSTTFSNPFDVGSSNDSHHLARGYYWDKIAGTYVPELYDDNSANPGAGAIYSTVNDYALWIKAFLDAADSSTPLNSTSPISPELFHDLVTPRSIVSEVGSGQNPDYGFITPPLYALGWLTVQILGETIIAHSGAQTGFGADVYMLPTRGYGIVTMANTEHTSNLAGSAIASRLLLEKLNMTSPRDEHSVSSLQQTLHNLTAARTHPSKPRVSQRSLSAEHCGSSLQPDGLPLPGAIADFAGLYNHQAYGSINFTVVEFSTTNALTSEALDGLLYPRVSPLKIQLVHSTATVFNVNYFSPHGLGDIRSGEGITWEDQSEGEKAVFTFGLDGKVQTMGIEIEGSMIEMARKKGVSHWREGMIWFEKQ